MPVGRPKGIPKTGGRRKGSQNRITKAKTEKIAASGLTPLDYMLLVMRDGSVPRAERLDAAKSAAPYVHPRLAAVEHSGPDGGPILYQKIERVIVDPAN
jgi:hypothetical protein